MFCGASGAIEKLEELNGLPWQCQHYNRVKILLVLSWLVIQLQGKMKLGFPPIDRGLMVSLLLCVL